MSAGNRLPELSPEAWTPEQRVLAEEVINGPRGALLPPFQALIRSPELMSHTQRMGEYLRYRSSIGQRLSELAILLTARYWSQPVEWEIHAPVAQQRGISPAAIAAIQADRLPETADLSADEWVVYAFCHQLHRQKKVSDSTWTQAVSLFDEQGVMDLIGINGYYTLLAMVMNSAQTPPQSADAVF